MELKNPKRKRTSRKLQQPFPGMVVNPFTQEIVFSGKYEGIFNGFGVTIHHPESIADLYNNGFFGKGSLSRSAPQILFRNKNVPEILRKRQYDMRLQFNPETGGSSDDITETSDMVIVLPDSDDENICNKGYDIKVNKDDDKKVNEDEDIYFKNLSIYLQKDISNIRETLLLTLEEAFFLTYAIGCLSIKDMNNKLLDLKKLWQLFNETQNDFLQKFIVYHYFRSKRWVVKSGLKYGSDFLLYKDGPPFYHASYIATIEVFRNYDKDESMQSTSLNRNRVSALTRLSVTSGKEVILAQIFFPENFENDLNNISQVKVNEVLLQRIFLEEIKKKKL